MPTPAELTRVVIESPCAPFMHAGHLRTITDNADYLRLCLRDSIANGEAPIASHGLFAFSNVFNDSSPEEREACMAAGWAWITEALAVVIYSDFGITPGMQAGIAYAQQHGIPIRYRKLFAEDPRDDINHQLHDVVCGHCGKTHPANESQ